MTINPVSISLLDSALSAEKTRREISVAVLKKAQDSVRLEGEAALKLLEAAAPDPGRLLDVYA